MREVIITSIQFYKDFTRKTTFFLRSGLSSSSIILGLVRSIALKFYTSVAKGLKLKVKKLFGLIVTFIEVTGE